MSRTGTLGRLFGHAAEPAVELHAQDMARLRLADGDLVQSPRGAARSCCRRGRATRQPAQAFIAMHWGEEFLSAAAAPASGGPRPRASTR